MIEIYTGTYCNYCHKVIGFLNENKIPYTNKDISDVNNRNFLVDNGGKMQIPFLHDTDKNIMMYESDEIIKFIKENYSTK